MSSSVTVQLQYSFSNADRHSLDAFIRNDNERDFLLILRDVASELGIDVQIESEALRVGSLRSLWKVIGENEKQIRLVGGIIITLMITVPLAVVQYENISLDNALKREELKQLKKDVIAADSAQVQEIVNRVVEELRYDLKIQVHKSNFYKRLVQKNDVTDISTVQLDQNGKPIGEVQFVYRPDFSKFILKSNKLPPVTDEDAIVEIISPVLKAGDFAWKGIYNDEVISFKMLDQYFKGAVLSKNITFANGDSIKCVMQLKRELDEVGGIRVTERNVLIVIEKIDRNQPPVVTPQGQKFLRTKKERGNQLNLFERRAK